MIFVAIIKRTLKDGKTYEDFRRAWYHKVGFGTRNRVFTVLNGANPREIIVIGLTETTLELASELLSIDANERQDNPLADVIEPEIDRTYGILISEDDFSARGAIEYKPATVDGKETDLAEVAAFVEEGTKLLTESAR
ncbi:MAG: ROK family protein [Candidatus Limnocylindrales bacterium]